MAGTHPVFVSSPRSGNWKAVFARRPVRIRLAALFGNSGSGAPAFRRSGVSLTGSLVALVAVVALPLMLLGVGALWWQYLSQRSAAETQLVEHARTVALLVDREFERTRAVAQTLAAAAPAAGGDLNAFEAQLRAARDRLSVDLPPGAPRPVLSFIGADGAWLLHTAWAPGERRTGLHATSFGLAAIAEGVPKISDLFIAPTSGALTVGLAVPVFAPTPPAGGPAVVVGGIGISIPRERLIAIVNQAGFPAGGSASVLDRKGITVARSLHDAETVGQSPVTSALNAVLASQSGLAPLGTVTLEKVPAITAFARAPETGYILKIDVPEQVFLAPLRDSILRSALIGLSVLLCGLVLAIRGAHRIVRAFDSALGTAARIGGTSATPMISTGLREADAFAALLVKTFAEREEATRNARALIDNSPIGIIIFDIDGRVHEANDAFLTIVGRTRADLSGDGFKWTDMTPDQWVAADQTACAEALRTGQCTPYEKQYLRADRTLVPVLVSFSLTSKASGQAAGFILDLTEQLAAEATHHETEERLSFSLRAGRLGAWELNLATKEVRCSEITIALLGLGAAETITYDHIRSMIHPDDRERVRLTIAGANQTSGDVRAEYRVIWPDGSVHWIESRGRALNEAGKPNQLAGVLADVTERKQAEAALRDSELRLRAITDALPQMVWAARPDGFRDYFNQRWYDLTGTTRQQIEGDGWIKVLHPDDQSRAQAVWHHSLATGDTFESEYRLRMVNGSYRCMLGRAVAVREEQTGEILRWFGTCTDIEDTVAARETLAQSRDELECLIAERTKDLQATQTSLARAQRMEALGQLAGGIAHDFNNVLQAVEAGCALLEKRPHDADGVRHLAGMMLEAAERGASVTRRLLGFSRRGDLRAEPVEPAALLADIREILSHTLGDGVKVVVDPAPDLPRVLVDKGQLETVLVNLATNGRDAMSGIGTLILAATPDIVRPDQVAEHQGRLSAGLYVRLSVSDTGTGMNAETLAHASEPFFTTKPNGKGTGLGLAMARGFAEQSGGGFYIASTLGQGTTVTLWFPITRSVPPGDAMPLDVGLAAARPTGWRLLLVDDDRIVRELTSDLMELEGFTVLAVESAAAALAVLDRNEGVDVLVSDLSMPDMDGVSLIQEAQRRRPGLPAILLTGFSTSAADIAVDAAGGGTFSLLRKPIQAHVLAARVAELLDADAGSGSV